MPSLIIAASLAAILSGDSTCHATRKAATDASAILHRAAERTGLTRAGGKPLHTNGFDLIDHGFESDRMYPPNMIAATSIDEWFDPSSGVVRTSGRTVIGGYDFPNDATIGDSHASYSVQDTTLTASDETHGAMYESRPLNAWAVLHDWLAAADVRVESICTYRDYPRIVLTRRDGKLTERLFLDPKSGYPTKLDRIEPHYLWGHVHAEYVYSTWERIGDAHLPGATFRVVDGVTMTSRAFAAQRFVPADSAPRLTIPARAAAMTRALPGFLVPSRPDTIRVSATTYLLRNRGYTETVTLQRDTVFVFDATQGDERVAQDSVWIATLFPGRHPIVVVVTDLAWPHVSGVRAWVARGATIVSHRAARAFLTSVVNRKWTLAPDLLERRRAHASFKFREVRDSLRLAGGDILLFPIDGAASEVALAAFVRPDRFLWGSDFVQNLRAPSQYVDDVVAAVQRVGVSPANVAAEHAPLTPWEKVLPLAERPANP